MARQPHHVCNKHTIITSRYSPFIKEIFTFPSLRYQITRQTTTPQTTKLTLQRNNFCSNNREGEQPHPPLNITPISSSRTKIVAELWKKRAIIDARFKQPTSSASPPSSTSTLLNKSPDDSLEQVEYNFGSDKHLVIEYQSFQKGEVRYGRILEDMDAMAGNIAFSHADDDNYDTEPNHIVTACVDRIDIVRPFPLNTDLVMEGYVFWVGTSSMLIKVRIMEKLCRHEILEATFLMAARNQSGKAQPINKLIPQTTKQHEEFQEGITLINQRKHAMKEHIHVKPPSYDEYVLIHSQFFPSPTSSSSSSSSLQSGGGGGGGDHHFHSFPPRPQRLMSETKLQSVVLCQPQEKNTRDRIFGGYLMRKAYELGESTAHLFCRGSAKPLLIAIGEITFLHPVEIGSIIRFDSFVSYSTLRACQIQVSTTVVDLIKHSEYKSNTFEFTFGFKDTEENFKLPEVKPLSYLEAMQFLSGKRRFDYSRASAIENDTLLLPYFL